MDTHHKGLVIREVFLCHYLIRKRWGVEESQAVIRYTETTTPSVWLITSSKAGNCQCCPDMLRKCFPGMCHCCSAKIFAILHGVWDDNVLQSVWKLVYILLGTGLLKYTAERVTVYTYYAKCRITYVSCDPPFEQTIYGLVDVDTSAIFNVCFVIILERTEFHAIYLETFHRFFAALVRLPSQTIRINSSSPGHFTDDNFIYIFVNEKFWNLNKISLKFVPKSNWQ